MIYNIDGTELNTVYDVQGNVLSQAYDIDGNPLLPVTPPSNELIVMSYNIQWFSGLSGNQSMQEEIFETYNADIIGFQEFQRASSNVIPTMATTLLSPNYPYIQMGNYGNKNAIASKYQMSNFETVPFTDQTMDGQSYVKATINFNGKEILIVNSHLTTSSAETQKVAQAKETYDAVKDAEYFILVGDFNTICKSVNDTEYTTIMKQFVDLGCNCANCTEQFGFLDTWTSGSTASGTWYPCDHVITSSNIAINNVVVDTKKIDIASETGQSIDHLPIIAYLTVN
jgi:endonuclease/exonuclease/phosphatase family metal-dependent hydrolase